MNYNKKEQKGCSTNQAACFCMKCQLWHKYVVAVHASFVLCTARPLPPYILAVFCMD